MSQWRVAIGQKQYGPYSLEKLREIYREGRIPEEAQIWHPEEQQWLEAASVSELQEEANDFVFVDNPAPVRESQSQRPNDSTTGSDDSLSDFLAFRRMITPIMIQIIFWVGAVLSSMAGIFMMISAIKFSNVGGIFLGFFTMLLGPIAVRIYCELLIIFFRMNETLSDIYDELKRSS